MPGTGKASSLRHQIARRANRIRRSDLITRMGYRHVNEKLLARIDSVLGDEWLGLAGGGFDFRYSSEEFLTALCDALAIDPALRDAERARIGAIVEHRRTAFRPRIFIDTGFKRASQPIFALAAMEHRRWIFFEQAFVDLDLAAQFRAARERVIEHSAETDGVLALWGTIQRYLFEYDHHAVLVMDTAGRAIAETDAIRTSRAAVTVDGQDASTLLSVATRNTSSPSQDD